MEIINNLGMRTQVTEQSDGQSYAIPWTTEISPRVGIEQWIGPIALRLRHYE